MSHSLRSFIGVYNNIHEKKFGYIERIEEVVDIYANLCVVEREAICEGTPFTLDVTGEVESVSY